MSKNTKIHHLLLNVEAAFHSTDDVFKSDLISTGISRDLVLSSKRGCQPLLHFFWHTFTELRALAVAWSLTSP